jgi:hypothetical protein
MLQAGDASDRTYTIHLPPTTTPAKIELTVAQSSAEWEMAAVYDAARCEIHCSWRRKRDALGPMPLLAPPIAEVRIYSNFVSPPATVTVDPAGVGEPYATQDVPLSRESTFIPARRLFVTALAQQADSGGPKSPRTHFLSSTQQPEITFASSLPLRI